MAWMYEFLTPPHWISCLAKIFGRAGFDPTRCDAHPDSADTTASGGTSAGDGWCDDLSHQLGRVPESGDEHDAGGGVDICGLWVLEVETVIGQELCR
jgi:hypothetical protein